MKQILTPLVSFGLGMLPTDTASAASPIYCALYAKAFTKHTFMESGGSLSPDRIHDRAYHICLNMDDEPVLPTYTGSATDGVGGPIAEEKALAAPSIENEAVDATVIDETIVKETAALAVHPHRATAKRPKIEPATKPRRSGFAMWSPNWKNWCAKHFPKSFNPRTATVIRSARKPRLTICR